MSFIFLKTSDVIIWLPTGPHVKLIDFPFCLFGGWRINVHGRILEVCENYFIYYTISFEGTRQKKPKKKIENTLLFDIIMRVQNYFHIRYA